jgi:hypothetical protein
LALCTKYTAVEPGSGYRTGFARGQMLDCGRPERVHTNRSSHAFRQSSHVICGHSPCFLHWAIHTFSRPANGHWHADLARRPPVSPGITEEYCDPKHTTAHQLMCSNVVTVFLYPSFTRNVFKILHNAILRRVCLSVCRKGIFRMPLDGFS